LAGGSFEPEVIVNYSTAIGASRLKQLPLKSRMSTRDFIHNSLYNPNYGYFSKNAKVFTPTKPFNFNALKSTNDFTIKLTNMYSLQETGKDDIQLWHTPSELFQPFYGNSMARYLIDKFKADTSTENLIIYEIGAGNGTLMKNILDFIEANEPEIYKTTKYNIIEISTKLASIQNTKKGNHPLTITNTSILDFEKIETDPCFFIAMEVLVKYI
jgi:SAM-dependent MidA family methyltransferase